MSTTTQLTPSGFVYDDARVKATAVPCDDDGTVIAFSIYTADFHPVVTLYLTSDVAKKVRGALATALAEAGQVAS